MNNKSRTKLFLVVLLLLGLLSFFVFYGAFDLFKFPFLASVWGTAADWAMVIITALTVVYIIRTFNEQRIINQKTIENYQYLILPVFAVSQTIQLDPIKGSYFFELKLKKNSARNVAPSKGFGNFVDFNDVPIKFFLPENDSIRIRCTRDKAANYEFLLNTIYRFSFRDIMGNLYFQEVLIKNDHTLSLNQPEPSSNKGKD